MSLRFIKGNAEVFGDSGKGTLQTSAKAIRAFICAGSDLFAFDAGKGGNSANEIRAVTVVKTLGAKDGSLDLGMATFNSRGCKSFIQRIPKLLSDVFLSFTHSTPLKFGSSRGGILCQENILGILNMEQAERMHSSTSGPEKALALPQADQIIRAAKKVCYVD